MNPVLIKPEADTRSQVVVLGEADLALSQLPWRERRAHLWPVVRDSLHGLLDDYDVVVIEGAGSPAEINLRDGDIVNMAVALEVAAPVLLCCDIDRGGAFAHLLGTWHCLAERRAQRCSPASCSTASAATRRCSRPGPAWLEERTGVPTLGRHPLARHPAARGGRRRAAGRGRRGPHRHRRPAPDREPRRVRAARRACALRAHPGRDRGRRRDRDPRHQEHAGRSRVAALDRPRRRDRAARGRRRAGARHLRRAADARPQRARSARCRGRRRGGRARPARPRDRAAGGQDDAARAASPTARRAPRWTATRSTTARPSRARRRRRR